VATAGGQSYFNNTGNAGMAKGGSGDVLTGIITSFAAQGYAPASAAVFGVYLHGLSGDIAANVSTQETMTPTDIIRFLPEAFRQIRPDVN
jgi:NAD(P)H-hydrate repair Nnr-like enzyme with NAD(P)H-hydrate dehydratase domain